MICAWFIYSVCVWFSTLWWGDNREGREYSYLRKLHIHDLEIFIYEVRSHTNYNLKFEFI